MKSGVKLLLSLVLTLFLSSCFAIQNFSQSTKTIQSYISDNITIDPSIKAKKQIYITLSNGTIYDDLNLENSLKEKFSQFGFSVLEKPQNSPIIIDAKIRYYGIFEKEILNAMLEDRTKKDAISGFRGFEDFAPLSKPKFKVDFSGILIGGVTGFLIFKNVAGAFGGAVLISGFSAFLEKLFEPQTLLAFVDVNVQEISKNKIKTFDFRQVKLGEGGTRKIEFIDETDYKIYQTKIIVVLKRKHLSEENGIGDAKKQIISSIFGLI